MTPQDVEERLNKSITALKELEKIVKSLEAPYDMHITRLNWLKHLADSCVDLKKLEMDSLRSAQIAAQVAAQQAAQQAQAQAAAQAQAQQAAQQAQAASQSPEQEVAKRTKKKVE